MTSPRPPLAGAPLLNLVDHPVAVNADETLADYARSRGWTMIELR